ncbi:unnamed protein product [Arctia plantaginis]|uniref:Uncharacterized protein n=1 Tax=Arctia plantaginis TaxID=874455 RepID=A0A8S0YTV1_ARCPL|nr:unnamed protein product [Arctia plantaginis]
MSVLSSLFRLPTVRHVVKKPGVNWSYSKPRSYADKHKTEINKDKQSQLQGTENEQRMRVRRARPSDVPRVLRFVRENARTSWPGFISPPTPAHTVLCDYISRALSQGHSMLAEQQESRRGWSQIRGLALGLAVCPWDAEILERWARCIRCSRSKRLVHFTAHCLRAPALHEKYRVHNILQVILIVPRNSPKNSEIVHILAKNAIQRGRDVGIPVLRFDVMENTVAKALEEMKLNKEWQFSYDILPDTIKSQNVQPVHLENITDANVMQNAKNTAERKPSKTITENSIVVYTAFADKL